MNKTKICVLCRNSQFTILFRHHKHWKMGKCRSCGLTQVVPMPSGKEIGALYHEDFDHFTPYIEQLAVHRRYFRDKINDIRLKINDNAKSQRITHHSSDIRYRILDIGCAMGVLLSEAKRVGMSPVGIDLSADAVGYCKKKGFVCHFGTVQSLSGKKLRNGTFDVITAFQVIEHERDPMGMVLAMKKLLRPGGILVMATPNAGGFWRAFMGRRWFGFAHPEHVVLFDHKTMRQLFIKAGFRDVEVQNDTPRPFPLSFAFTRAADYFPWLAWFLKPIGRVLDGLKIVNPLNPWDDMIAFARK